MMREALRSVLSIQSGSSLVTISYATCLRKKSTISHSMNEEDSFIARNLKRREFGGFQLFLLSPKADELEPRHPVDMCS